MGSNITNVLLLYIIINVRGCKTKGVVETASRLPTDLETSTEGVDRFSLEQKRLCSNKRVAIIYSWRGLGCQTVVQL